MFSPLPVVCWQHPQLFASCLLATFSALCQQQSLPFANCLLATFSASSQLSICNIFSPFANCLSAIFSALFQLSISNIPSPLPTAYKNTHISMWVKNKDNNNSNRKPFFESERTKPGKKDRIFQAWPIEATVFKMQFQYTVSKSKITSQDIMCTWKLYRLSKHSPAYCNHVQDELSASQPLPADRHYITEKPLAPIINWAKSLSQNPCLNRLCTQT